VGFPHLGQLIDKESPQLLHLTQPTWIGARHLGHLVSSGFTFPHAGHTFEFGGTSWPQYLHGF
jgi:hypothetical protein